jgi:hypothetical protein
MIDQNADAGATTQGSPAPQAGDAGQGSAGFLTAKTTGTPATPPLAEGGATDQPPGWVAALTSEQKANTELVKELATRFPRGAPDLVAHYVETKAKTGVTVPNEKSTAEERAAYRKAIGVPDKPTDYKLEKGKAPAGFEYPDTRMAALAEAAHKAGLTQAQLSQLFLWDQKSRLSDAVEAAKQVKATVAQTEGELKSLWKGDYALQTGYMERAAQHYFEKFPGLADKLSRSGLANDMEFIRFFAELGRGMSPRPFVEGGAPTPTQNPADVMYPKAK